MFQNFLTTPYWILSIQIEYIEFSKYQNRKIVYSIECYQWNGWPDISIITFSSTSSLSLMNLEYQKYAKYKQYLIL